MGVVILLEERISDAVGRVMRERHADVERLVAEAVDEEVKRQVAALLEPVSQNGNRDVTALPESETRTCRVCGRAHGEPGVTIEAGRHVCGSCKARRARERRRGQRAGAPAEEPPRPGAE